MGRGRRGEEEAELDGFVVEEAVLAVVAAEEAGIEFTAL